LFLAGRGDAYEKYLETLDDWHAEGWQVTAADWRGQAGSGRLGHDPHTGHVDDFALWIDDLAAFWSEWRANNPAPHVLIGHSMGGHLALRAVAEKRADPAALVLSAPMLGFAGPKLPPALLHGVSRLMRRLGNPARPAWKWSEKPGELPAARQDLLTHDDARYADEVWWRAQRPEIVMGPGSWGWVERAYASMRGLFKHGMLQGINTPVLILAAKHDRLVGNDAIEGVARRLPRATLVSFGPEARHELLREADPVRNRVLEAIRAFLDTCAPLP
jgi:lysophospholipase